MAARLLGEPDPAVQAELDLACGGGGLPGEVDVAFGEQRVDELAGVPLAECSQGGVALGRPGFELVGGRLELRVGGAAR